MASGTKIADFFVKIGFDVSKIGDLKAVTEQLNAAATQANALAANLANVEKSLKRLQVPAALKPFVKESKAKDKADQKKKSAFPDEERIGPPLALFRMHMEQQKLAQKESDKAQKESDKKSKEQERQLIRTQRLEEKTYREKLKQKLVLEKMRQKEEKDANKDILNKGKMFGQLAQGKTSVMDLTESFTGLSASELAFGFAITGAVAGMAALSKWATQTAENLFKFKLATGLSTQELQAWQLAAGKAGVDGSEVANSLKNIQTAQAQIALGQGNIAPWALLGINPNQDPNKALWDIHERIKESAGMAPGMARLLTSQLGISEEMFQFLRRDNIELTDLNRKLSLSDKATKSFDAVNQSTSDLGNKLGLLGMNIARLFNPTIKLLADGLDVVATALTLFLGAIDDIIESDAGSWFESVLKSAVDLILPLTRIADLLKTIGGFFGMKFGNQTVAPSTEAANSFSSQGRATGPGLSAGPTFSASSQASNNSLAGLGDSLADMFKLNLMPSNNRSTVSNQKTLNVTMNIDGSKDPKAVADYAAAAIRKHMNDQHSLVSDLSSVGSFVT